MRIAFASDHAGYALKRRLLDRAVALGHDASDLGCHGEESCDYPDYAAAAARAVADRACDRAVVVCGTGLGVCMAANKVPGARAAVAHDLFTATMSREHNDANVLCLGARVLAPESAEAITEAWLAASFAGGRHARRVEKIAALDRGR